MRPEELRALCALDNVTTVWETGVNFNPFTRHFRLSKDMSVNYMMAAKRR